MKRSHSWLLVALLLVSCGGGDSGTNPPPGGGNELPDPEPTAVGTPNGAPTTQTIGAAGGSVASSDGAFTLNIPAGALASDTDITVQPITNTAWGGFGGGYQLTPDGLTFAQPVELVFQVPADALAGSTPEALEIAVQDDNGFWFVLKDPVYDDGAGTLTCATTHFSSYAGVEGVQIRPPVADVAVNGSVDLTVEACYYQEISNDPLISAALLVCNTNPYPVSEWSVNGVRGGNSSAGRVAATANPSKARYTAPATVPLAHMVAVSAKIQTTTGYLLVVSNITVYNGYHGTITHVDEGGSTAVWTVTWESDGTLGPIETFTGRGTMVYTLAPDPNCNVVAFDPNHGPVDTLTTYMMINHQPGTSDPPLIVTANAHWPLHACFQCASDPVSCYDDPLLVGFQDSEYGTISADGNTITGYFVDLGSEESWNYQFTR